MSDAVNKPTPLTAATVRQLPSRMPIHKYRPFEAVDIPDRTWPGRRVTEAPAGCPPICGTATRP